jgi:redox-sensitive bicupin YhaK (pirin superfamily)
MFLVVISGSVSVNDTTLNKRDAMSITDTDTLQITATENAELLLIEVPMY